MTFPLIFVGGLVTTYDAGMAVPDWPNTYGYNMFAYPLSTWWQGPWDLFIEHGHRLLGTLSGLFAIFFVIMVFRCDPRKWMRWAAIAALLLVIGQGVLGGIRVLAVDKEIAKIHGCVGPLFFSFTAVLVVLTSKRWFTIRRALNEQTRLQTSPGETVPRIGVGISRLALTTFILAYLQLFLGANLRHFSVEAPPSSFAVLVVMHLVLAGLVVFHALLLWRKCSRGFRQLVADSNSTSKVKSAFQADQAQLKNFKRIRRFSLLLFISTVAQTLLGLGTWVVKYGIPAWVANLGIAADYVPVAKSMFQANVVTFHVATGSLILAFSIGITLKAFGAAYATAKHTEALTSTAYGATT